MVDDGSRRGTTQVHDHRVEWSQATYAEAYRKMVLSYKKQPGALGARLRGFPKGLSDQEGYALLMEYLRRQRAHRRLAHKRDRPLP